MSSSVSVKVKVGFSLTAGDGANTDPEQFALLSVWPGECYRDFLRLVSKENKQEFRVGLFFYHRLRKSSFV